MASQKLKAASQRKFQRPSTPYIRPKSKSFVQTVKDWLTPSKWISQGVDENNVDTSNDHAPSVVHWPGTPHPIRGHHLDQHGRTHSIKEPVPQVQYSLEEELDHEIIITRGESVPFLAGEEEISTDEEDMDVKDTATAHSQVPITESNSTHISRNGLIPATESGPLLHYSQKVTLRPVKKPQVSSNSPKLNLSSSPQGLLTSTPQISPLERLHSSLPSSASPVTNVDKTPVVVPSTRPSFSVAAFKTPTQTLTNLSLSRSPFNSPFYTGRTAFGGASSGQKAASFRKRTRTDTKSSNTVPVRHVIKSHPPDSTHFSKDAASETARRILDTLQSLSTPLQDARKLPLRVASPAKRQRIESSRRHHSSPLSPPPPVASLTAPIRAPLSHIKQPFVKVPSEIQPPKETRTVSVDLTSPTPMSPPATKPAKSHSPFSSQSGKIRSAKHTSHYSSKNKKEDATSNNPLELPSPIPLPLSPSGALPVFSFGNLLSPNSVLKTSGANSSFSIPAVTVSTMSSIVTTCPSTSQSEMYSFKSPTIFTTKSYSQTTPTSTSTDQFKFSKPVIVDETTPSTTRQMSALSKPSFTSTSTLTPTLPTSSSITYSSLPPPLKTLSVLDALKRPEYQIENIRKEAQKQAVMTDVSKMDTSATSVAKQLSLTKTVATSTPTCTTVASASPGIIATSVSNWTCDECWIVNVESQAKCVACGTKRPVVGGVSDATKLTSSNTPKVTISVGEEISLKTASSILPPPSTTLPFKLPLTGDLNLSKEKPQTTPLTKVTPSAPPNTSSNSKSIPLSVFAPPTSNWECPSCLVSNQPEKQFCIACGSKACEDTSITNIEKSESNNKVKPSLAAFAPPTSNWECPTCMISNKTEVKTCGACGANKPGGNHGDDTKATQTFKLGESGGLKLTSNLFGKPVSEASSSDEPKLSSQSSGGFKINVSLSGITKSQSEIGNSITTQVTSLKSSEPTSVPSLVPCLPTLTTFKPNLIKTTSTTLNIPKPNLTSNTFSGLKFEAPPIVSTSSQPSKPTPVPPTIPSLNFPNTAPPTSQPPASASLFSSFISPTITPTSTSNQSSESGNVSTLFPNIGGAGLFGNNKTIGSSTGGNNQQLLFGQKESAPFPTLSTSTLQSTTAQTSNIFGGGGNLMATSQTGNAGFAVSSFLTATQASSTTMLASSQTSNINLPIPPQTGLLGGSDCSITQTPSLTGGSSGLSVFSGCPKSTQSSLVFPSFGLQTQQTQLIPTQATGGIFNPSSAVSSQGGGKSGNGNVAGGIFGGATKSNPITMSGAATSTGFNFTQMTPSINFTSVPNQGPIFGQPSSSVSSTPFQFSGTQSGNLSSISNPSQGGYVFGQPSANTSFQFTGNQAGNQSGQSSASIPSQGLIFGQPPLSTAANAQFSFGGQTGMSIPTVEMSSQQNPFVTPACMNPCGRGGKSGRTMKKAVRKRFGGK